MLWTVVVVTGFLAIMISITFFHDWNRSRELNQLDATTEGLIVDIKKQDYIRHSLAGSQVRIYHYDIQYEYFVEGKKYIGLDRVEGTQGTIKRVIKIYQFDKKKVTIKYDSRQPSMSLLDLELPASG